MSAKYDAVIKKCTREEMEEIAEKGVSSLKIDDPAAGDFFFPEELKSIKLLSVRCASAENLSFL